MFAFGNFNGLFFWRTSKTICRQMSCHF